MSARAHRLAELVCRRLGFQGPPASPAMLVAMAPIDVVAMDWPQELSGMLVLRPGGAIIGLNQRHASGRRHFTFWHEVGHLLLHRGRLEQPLPCYRPSRRPVAQERLEQEADAFAAAVTMPHAWVRAAIADPVDILELARRFGVTPLAMRRRLHELGLEARGSARA